MINGVPKRYVPPDDIEVRTSEVQSIMLRWCFLIIVANVPLYHAISRPTLRNPNTAVCFAKLIVIGASIPDNFYVFRSIVRPYSAFFIECAGVADNLYILCAV